MRGHPDYSHGYEYARWVHEHGDSPWGPYRGDYVPVTCEGDDHVVFWQGYSDYWFDVGIAEYRGRVSVLEGVTNT